MQKQISALLERDLSRKEFIIALGFGMATLLGLGSLLGFLGQKNPLKRDSGYGSSPYGS